MFCPKCGCEYREGFTVCADCQVDLVEAPPAGVRGKKGPMELVTVLETGDKGLIAVAQSLLMGSGIKFLTKGEGVQELFGLGRLFVGYNLVTGPVAIQVRAEDAEDARVLLADLLRKDGGGDDQSGENGEDETDS